MKVLEVEDKKYEVIKDYREGFDEEEFKLKYTDYFYDYDYICGDWAYGKLRLKGFYDPSNKKVKEINNYKYIDKYINNNCANDCRHFIVKLIR